MLMIAEKCIFPMYNKVSSQTYSRTRLKNEVFFFEWKTINPNNRIYLFKTIGIKLWYVIYGSTTVLTANLICLANTRNSDLIMHHIESNVTTCCLRRWSTGLTGRKLPIEWNISAEFYAKEARKTRTAHYCTYRRISGVQYIPYM